MENIVSQGAELALFGMGTVFVFLTVLIGATALMSALVLRFSPLAVSEEKRSGGANSSKSSPAEGELLAVISSAIQQFRKDQDR